MYKTSYLREVRKEKYERSDGFDEQSLVDFSSLGLSQAQGLENLQDLNERFANYINRARVLEQRNAIFRKQLETFQRMDEISGLEEAFAEQIELNCQRLRELSSDRSKLEREYKDAQRTVDEFKNKYRNECEYQHLLKDNLERLNREADEALLSNLELQIESQFLQDDINAAKDRYKKNLMEIQTYVNILQQIIQTTPPVTTITGGMHEEKLMSERRIPILQCQLEEYKSILCQLQAQKVKLQSETSMLEQAIKNTQESYDDEIQLYNEQIEVLRKGIEEAERSLEKFTNDCRQLVIYQQSLENELERYKRIIENEDNRLNSAIVGTPITLFMQSYKSSQISPTRRKDITLAIQDIATAKPRQKGVVRKTSRRKEISMDKGDIGIEDKVIDQTHSSDKGQQEFMFDSPSQGEAEKDFEICDRDLYPEDVPDGAQISKAFDKLCNIVRDRIRGYKKPEPSPDFFTKGRYVLVTGESSYVDPCFISSIPQAGGRITVSISHDIMPGGDIVLPIPELPEPSEPSESGEDECVSEERKEDEPEDKDETKRGEEEKVGEKGKQSEDKAGENGKQSEGKEEEPKKTPSDIKPGDTNKHGQGSSSSDSVKPQRSSRSRNNDKEDSLTSFRGRDFPSSMSYEKVEVVESIEKFSDDRIRSYEETAMIVETTIEKTRKK